MSIAFEDLRDTESGTCVVIGGGPNLLKMPRWFLTDLPSFGTNYLHRRTGIIPTYHVTRDEYDPAAVFHEGRASKIRFVHEYIRSKMPPDFDIEDGVWFSDMERKLNIPFHNEMKSNPKWAGGRDANGVAYISTGHVSAWLASYLGFTTILLAGMDCSVSNDEGLGQTRAHIGLRVPHYHNMKEFSTTICREDWNTQWGLIHENMKDIGVTMVNVTPNTLCTTVPRSDWRNYA